MDELPGWAATTVEVWAVLTASRQALLTPAEVRGRLGLRGDGRATPESVLDALANLDAEGYVETWEGAEPRVILSSHAAEGMGLALSDNGEKWEEATKKNRPHRMKRRKRLKNETETGVRQQRRADPSSPDPLAPDGDGFAPPRVLLGEGLIWQGPKWAASRPCPGRSRDRWRVDRLDGVKAARHWRTELQSRTCLLCSSRVAERQDARRRGHVLKADAKRIAKATARPKAKTAS